MNNKILKTIGISLLFLLIALVIAKYYFDKNSLKNEYRITIGNVYNYEILTRSGYDLYFNYSVNGKKYKADYIIYNNPKSFINRRFFVAFLPSNPENSKIILEKPVPPSLKQAPLEGWGKIPRLTRKGKSNK